MGRLLKLLGEVLLCDGRQRCRELETLGELTWKAQTWPENSERGVTRPFPAVVEFCSESLAARELQARVETKSKIWTEATRARRRPSFRTVVSQYPRSCIYRCSWMYV